MNCAIAIMSMVAYFEVDSIQGVHVTLLELLKIYSTIRRPK